MRLGQRVQGRRIYREGQREDQDMIKLQDVSYVRLGTADLDGATKFATEFLGLEVSYR